MEGVMIQVEKVSSVALLSEISKMLDAKLSKLAPVVTVDDDVYVSRLKVAEMFGVSLPTVHAWMNAGILKPYKIGNKTRFLLREVKAAAIGTTKKREVANV